MQQDSDKANSKKKYSFEDYITIRNSKVCNDIPWRYYFYDWFWALFYFSVITTMAFAYFNSEISMNANKRFCTFYELGGFNSFLEIYFRYKNDSFGLDMQIPVIVYLAITLIIYLICVLRFGFSVKIDWHGFYSQDRLVTPEDRVNIKTYRGNHFFKYAIPILFSGLLCFVVFYDCIIMVMNVNNVHHFTWLEYFNYKWPWTPYIIVFSNYTLVRYWPLEVRYDYVQIVLDKLQNCPFSEFKKLNVTGLHWKWRELWNVDYSKLDMNWSLECKYALASRYENMTDLTEAIFARVSELHNIWLDSLPKTTEVVVEAVRYDFAGDFIKMVVFMALTFSVFHVLSSSALFGAIPDSVAAFNGFVINTVVQSGNGSVAADLALSNFEEFVSPQISGATCFALCVVGGMKLFYGILSGHIDVANVSDVFVVTGTSFIVSTSFCYHFLDLIKFPLLHAGIYIPTPLTMLVGAFYLIQIPVGIGYYVPSILTFFYGAGVSEPVMLALDVLETESSLALALDIALIILYESYNLFLC